MMVLLRVHVFSLLVGSVVSLNHGAFIGNGNVTAGTSHMQSFEDFFEFYTPLPPIPSPPSERPTPLPVIPTKRPTKGPTPSPVILPTRPPVPAGRFPSPVTTPTFKPANKPGNIRPPTFAPVPAGSGNIRTPTFAPVPAGRWSEQSVITSSPTPSRESFPAPNNVRRQPPTFVPLSDLNGHTPVESNNAHSPVPIPTTRGPHLAPKNPYPTTPMEPNKVETRIASYKAEWGSEVNNCQHIFPNVFFKCHDGGVIGIKDSKNAKCTRDGNDRVQCTQDDINTDSSIGFTCSGITKGHLMSTVTVGPNVAVDCKRGGNVIKYLTLNRECTDFVDTNPDCNGGVPWKQGDTSYCASPAICSGQNSCSELELEPLAMSNTNTYFQCSRVDPDQDLQFHSFVESYLSSLTFIDWRVSGQKRGCLFNSSPLLIRCEGGGRLEFEEDYPFCSLIPEDNMAQCQSFAPYSVEKEESIGLSVRCIGMSESQLKLSVEIPSKTMDVECKSEGTIIQSVMLSRGCGELGTDVFTLVNHPSFCDAEEQVFSVDDTHAHCFVGNTCLSDAGCTNMQVPRLTADTGSGYIGQCTYVV